MLRNFVGTSSMGLGRAGLRRRGGQPAAVERLDSRMMLAAHIGANTYVTIQAAVDAAVAGDEITVDAGTYVEQVNVNKDITITGAGDATVVKSPASLSTHVQGSRAFNAVINVHNSDATIQDLKVDGDARGNGGAEFVGVGFFDAGGVIDNVTVVGTRDNPLSGNQDGLGILARNTVAATRNLTISNSRVSDYQKNGITVSDVVGDQITATIAGNTVTGAGPIGLGLPAQNGIQLTNATGASSIVGNTVSGQYYTVNTFTAAGILLSSVRPGTDVSGNTATDCNAGITMVSGTAAISGNTLAGNDYGVIAFAGTMLVNGNDFDDATNDNSLDFYISPTTAVTLGGNQFAGDDAYVYNDSPSPLDATGDSFDETSNFRIEDKMVHAVDDAATGLVTWVADNVYVTTPETGSTDSSIQRAVNAAPAGGAVNIEDGTYTEQVSINKAITLTGESEAGVIVQTGATAGLANNGKNAFTIAAPGGAAVTLQQMTVRNSDYGVKSTSGDVSILNATFYHNGFDGAAFPTSSQAAADAHYDTHATDGGAIRLQGSNNSELANLTVYENDRGIRLQDGDNAHVHDNVSHDNVQAGIYFAANTGPGGPTSPGVTNSLIENNQSYNNRNNGILLVGGQDITVRDNDLHDNWNSGVMVWYPSEVTIDDNTIDGNNAFAFNGEGNTGDSAGGGVSVFSSGVASMYAVEIVNNQITNNGAGRNTESQGIRFESTAAAVDSNVSCNTVSGHDVGAHLEGHGFTVTGNAFDADDVGVRVAAGATIEVLRGNDLSDGTFVGLENTTAATVNAEYNWWGTTGASAIDALAVGSVDFTPWLLGPSADSLVYTAAGGVSLVVNQATGEYSFTDADGVTYTGTGARVQSGKLKIHDQSGPDKLDASGDVDGPVTVSIRAKGKPTSYTLDALDLSLC